LVGAICVFARKVGLSISVYAGNSISLYVLEQSMASRSVSI
jgi:hypothetical protein